MSGLVNAQGLPIGRVGESTSGIGRERPDIEKLAEVYAAVIQAKASKEGKTVLSQQVSVNRRKVDTATAFWKPRYFDIHVDGRHLNGIEAYELGDPEKTPAAKVNPSVYIAMCNLMALEAITMMGANMPTSAQATLLAYATEREKEIAGFWKDNFAPTEFQVEWAWAAALAVMAGDPSATAELLDNYRDQLP
jgi:hypothetical protein